MGQIILSAATAVWQYGGARVLSAIKLFHKSHDLMGLDF